MKNLSNYQLCELSNMAEELMSNYSKYFHVHGAVTEQLEKELYKFKNDLDTEYQRREENETI